MCVYRPISHHNGVGQVRRARALGLLVDDQLHARVLAHGGLAQLLLQRAQQRQRRGQADQLVVAELDAVGNGAVGLLEPAAQPPPCLSLEVAVELLVGRGRDDGATSSIARHISTWGR